MSTNFLKLEGFYDVVASSLELNFEIENDSVKLLITARYAYASYWTMTLLGFIRSIFFTMAGLKWVSTVHPGALLAFYHHWQWSWEVWKSWSVTGWCLISAGIREPMILSGFLIHSHVWTSFQTHLSLFRKVSYGIKQLGMFLQWLVSRVAIGSPVCRWNNCPTQLQMGMCHTQMFP